MDLAGVGKEFLNDVLAQLSPEQRGAIEGVFADPSAAPALEALGQGAKRQADYSRSMDAVKETERAQHAWWDANQPLVDLGTKAKALGFDPAKAGTGTGVDSGVPAPAPLPTDVVRAADLEARERDVVGFTAFTVGLGLRHFRQFGEDLDIPGLVADATAKKINLQEAYDTKYADKLKVARDAADNAAFEKRYTERRQAERKNEHPSFPGSTSPMTGSPLDALEPVKHGADVSDLVNEYLTLTAGQ